MTTGNNNRKIPKTKENRNLVWRKDRGCYACRWMYDGELKQQTLLDAKGNPITKIESARIARDKVLAPFAMKQQEEVLAVLTARAERKRGDAARLVEEAYPPLQLEDAWKTYCESPKRPDSGDSTLDRYHSQFKRFHKWMNEHHADIVHMRDIDEDMAAAYAANLKASKYSPNAYNKHCTFLRLIWRTLSREIRGNGNPWMEIQRMKVPKNENSRRAISPEQFIDILGHADTADMHDLIFTLGWTGQRLYDVVMLKWASISFKRNVIEIIPQKTARRTGAKVVVPLMPRLADLLLKRREHVAGKMVFPEIAEIYDRNPSMITKRIQSAFDKAGLTPREDRAKLKRAVAVYGAHSLRHYFVTEAMAAGWPTDLIRKITGHTSEAMAQHYQHVDANLISRLSSQLESRKEKIIETPIKSTSDQKTIQTIKQIEELANELTPENAMEIKVELLRLVMDKEAYGIKPKAEMLTA